MSFPARREVERRLLEPPLQDDCWQPQNTPYDFKYEERTFYYLGEREGKSRKAQSIESPWSHLLYSRHCAAARCRVSRKACASREHWKSALRATPARALRLQRLVPLQEVSEGRATMTILCFLFRIQLGESFSNRREKE